MMEVKCIYFTQLTINTILFYNIYDVGIHELTRVNTTDTTQRACFDPFKEHFTSITRSSIKETAVSIRHYFSNHDDAAVPTSNVGSGVRQDTIAPQFLTCGCCPSPYCQTKLQPCSINIDCECLLMAITGGGMCADTVVSCQDLAPCGNGNMTCLVPNTICVNNTRCGIPVCYPIDLASSQRCPSLTSSNSNTTTNSKYRGIRENNINIYSSEHSQRSLFGRSIVIQPQRHQHKQRQSPQQRQRRRRQQLHLLLQRQQLHLLLQRQQLHLLLQRQQQQFQLRPPPPQQQQQQQGQLRPPPPQQQQQLRRGRRRQQQQDQLRPPQQQQQQQGQLRPPPPPQQQGQLRPPPPQQQQQLRRGRRRQQQQDQLRPPQQRE
ncbi:unnamed protein product [Rotaria socialis]